MSLIRGLLMLVVSVLLTLLLFSANLMQDDETKVVLRKGVDDDNDNDALRGVLLELDYLLGNGAPPLLSNSSSHLQEAVPMPVRSVPALDSNQPKEKRRPRKNPKGEIWQGWPKSSSSSRDHALPRNIGNSHQWWRNSRHCFEVDQICHGVKDNKWFYYPHLLHPTEGQDVHDYLFQPNMELKSAPAKYDGGRDHGESRISIKVSSSSVVHPDDIDFDKNGQFFLMNSSSHDNNNDNNNNMKCQISSIPTHIVLQSLFNDMIGEFYSRTLVRLYHLMMKGAEEQIIKSIHSDSIMPWDEDIQFYAHIAYGNKKMLDGHKLLLSGMLSNHDSPTAKSLIDLFIYEEGTEGSNRTDDDCQCYEKMVFCGYDIYTHDVNVLSKDLGPADIFRGSGNDDDEDGANEQNTNDDNAAMNLSFDYDLKYTLWSAASLDESEVPGCSRRSDKQVDDYSCQEWNGLRKFLATNFHRHYPTLEEDVLVHRTERLLSKGVIENGYAGNTREFRIIGLTQRTYRRAWIDLPDIIKKCDTAFAGRAICVEVNVEKMTSPYEQLVMHRSLDVMIGVHGAQLTQAILLPPQGHVLELLPWITDYIRGTWVQTTHHPTPLGVIFHNTDLNHIGYSLDRNSVPLCQGVQDEQLQSCFLKQKKKFIWENRDFVVGSEAVLQYIQNFVIFGIGNNRTCDEVDASLDERFVLYNIWCVKPNAWFLAGSDSENGNDCIYGSVYPLNSKDSIKAFDSREACCIANHKQCQTMSQQIRNHRENLTLTVLHRYHELKHAHSIDEVLPKRNAKRARIRQGRLN